jgi:uncharacterized protein (DUF305 family)
MLSATRSATRRTGIGTLTGAALLATVLAGCAGGGVAAGPTTGAAVAPGTAAADAASSNTAGSAAAAPVSNTAGPHNTSDVAFATGIIPHNVQALASTQIASSKAVKPQVKSLASTLGKQQVPEIEALSAWLTSWGVPVPGGGVAQPGTAGLTSQDLSTLSTAPPAGFDKLWLNRMIKHQQQAVALAQTEVKNGSNAQAKALAKKIITEKQKQITLMKALLKKA